MNANQAILTATITAAVTTLAAEYLEHKPVRYGRTITGALGLGFGLSFIALGSPETAQGIAYLVMITAILVNGQPILEAVNKGVK